MRSMKPPGRGIDGAPPNMDGALPVPGITEPGITAVAAAELLNLIRQTEFPCTEKIPVTGPRRPR